VKHAAYADLVQCRLQVGCAEPLAWQMDDKNGNAYQGCADTQSVWQGFGNGFFPPAVLLSRVSLFNNVLAVFNLNLNAPVVRRILGVTIINRYAPVAKRYFR
jgi:hypothetical protein